MTDERKIVDQYSLSKLKQTITSKKQSSNYNSSGDAREGTLSSGGLIHLLLVIALILLILWLLRVISQDTT